MCGNKKEIEETVEMWGEDFDLYLTKEYYEPDLESLVLDYLEISEEEEKTAKRGLKKIYKMECPHHAFGSFLTDPKKNGVDERPYFYLWEDVETKGTESKIYIDSTEKLKDILFYVLEFTEYAENLKTAIETGMKVSEQDLPEDAIWVLKSGESHRVGNFLGGSDVYSSSHWELVEEHNHRLEHGKSDKYNFPEEE